MSDYITLNTGGRIPVLGLGTWKASPNEVGPAVEYAITECGYKHLDCASIYLNEKEIGKSLSQIFNNEKAKRENIFITSKLWNYAHPKNKVEEACKQTLNDLRLDYLDLYLMHWGIAIDESTMNQDGSDIRGAALDMNGILNTQKTSVQETWTAMEELVSKGLVKAIGVANFTGMMLIDLLTYAKIKPAMNQIELHPYNTQQRLVDFCHTNGIVVTAYSPLGRPKKAEEINAPVLINDETIVHIANRHGKTPSQVMLRWGLQRGTVVIPKSVTPKNISENIKIDDFKLSPQEMEEIGGLDRKYRFVDPWEWWKVPYFD